MRGWCILAADRKALTLWRKTCGGNRTAALADEGGSLLLELLASLPVYLMLLISLFAIWLLFLRSGIVLMSDWELQQEMRLTLSRMAQDAGTATHVETPDLHELHIEKYIKGEKCTVDYVLREGKAGHPPYISKKVSGGPYGYSSPQPMTGGRNAFGSLAVVDFQCDIDRDGLLHLRLDGENRRTKKRVTFSTAVCTPREEH